MEAKRKIMGILLAVFMVFCMAPMAAFAADNVPDSVGRIMPQQNLQEARGLKRILIRLPLQSN